MKNVIRTRFKRKESNGYARRQQHLKQSYNLLKLMINYSAIVQASGHPCVYSNSLIYNSEDNGFTQL